MKPPLALDVMASRLGMQQTIRIYFMMRMERLKDQKQQFVHNQMPRASSSSHSLENKVLMHVTPPVGLLKVSSSPDIEVLFALQGPHIAQKSRAA